MADYLDSDAWENTHTLIANGNSYSFNIPESDIIDGYESWESASETLYVLFTGNAIPYNIHPKGFYNSGGESTEQLKVLKAILMLHNLTIISLPDGTIKLVNKADFNNNLIVIEGSCSSLVEAYCL